MEINGSHESSRSVCFGSVKSDTFTRSRSLPRMSHCVTFCSMDLLTNCLRFVEL